MNISNETYIIHKRLEIYSHGMNNANVFDSTDFFSSYSSALDFPHVQSRVSHDYICTSMFFIKQIFVRGKISTRSKYESCLHIIILYVHVCIRGNQSETTS